WPTIFERAIAMVGWQWTMIGFGLFQVALIVPLALLFLQSPPEIPAEAASTPGADTKRTVIGWNANLVFAMICFAAFLCCIPMAMPHQHLVAYCSDLGISATVAAAMLSML